MFKWITYQFSDTYFYCPSDNDTLRYHMTLEVTNFIKKTVFSRKTSKYFYYVMLRFHCYSVIWT